MTDKRTEYKHEFRATFEDAKMILKRFRKIAKPLGYSTAIYGSTVLNGHGHDIDVQIMGTEGHKVTPNELAMLIIHEHAKSMQLYEQKEWGDMQDVYLVFVTHDKLYIDMHVKGAN